MSSIKKINITELLQGKLKSLSMSLSSISLVSFSHAAGKVWPSFQGKDHVCKSFHTLSLFQLTSILILIILLLQSLNLSLLINSAG